MSNFVDELAFMFPDLDRGLISDVLTAKGNDVDKACDELLTLNVGDDIFARSIYVEEKLTASVQLKNVSSQQEEMLRQCKERMELEKAEAQKKVEAQKKAEAAAKQQKEKDLLVREQAMKNQLIEEQKLLEEKRKELLIIEQAKKEAKLQAEKEAQLSAKKEFEAQKQELAVAEAALVAQKEALATEQLKIEDEKKELAAKKAEAEAQPPKLTVYTRKNCGSEEKNQDEIVANIVTLFTSNGFENKEIAVVDVSQDMEVASFLKEICTQIPNITYPIVCAGRLPIGTIEEVKELVEDSQSLKDLLAGDYAPKFLSNAQTESLQDGTGTFVGQGVLDHCLDAAEYVVSAASSLLWLPYTVVSYPFRSEKQELVKGDDEVDFDIVHTNWYWRNLKRRFRFTKDCILRIHPSLNDVRASHPYSSIETVQRTNDQTIIIKYKEGNANPDTVTASPENIDAMINLIKGRCDGETPLFYDAREI